MSYGFIEHFSKLEDPRMERRKLHSLMDIPVLAVCAVIAAERRGGRLWRLPDTRNWIG